MVGICSMEGKGGGGGGGREPLQRASERALVVGICGSKVEGEEWLGGNAVAVEEKSGCWEMLCRGGGIMLCRGVGIMLRIIGGPKVKAKFGLIRLDDHHPPPWQLLTRIPIPSPVLPPLTPGRAAPPLPLTPSLHSPHSPHPQVVQRLAGHKLAHTRAHHCPPVRPAAVGSHACTLHGRKGGGY